tara:strand:- start:669 stop:1235 length:567 start_codon:yes stop_codon:yes gene_type:complete
MQKIKTKISKASIYQFENFFHLNSSNESFSSSYSDKNQIKVVSNILKNDSIKAIDITHFNSPPSIIPSKYYDKSIKAKYLETNSKISRNIEEDISSDKKITVIYSKRENLSKILKNDEKKINHTNHFTKLYNYLIEQLNNSDGLSFFVSLSDISFEVVIFNNDKFVFLKYLILYLHIFFLQHHYIFLI